MKRLHLVIGSLAVTGLLLPLFSSPVAAVSTTFTVNTTSDVSDGSGCTLSHCTLREAIIAANAHPGRDTIAFNIVGGGIQEIDVCSSLPTSPDPVIIDGYTQPGASPNTLAAAPAFNTVILIEVLGNRSGNGFYITAGDSVVRGLKLRRFNF